MVKRFFWAALLGTILIGKMHGQEVILGREKKPLVSTEAPTPPEQLASESPARTPRPSKSREKKSPPARFTLEEMRAAGARAAGGVNETPVSQSSKTRETDAGAPMTNPTVAESPRAVKREPATEQRNSSHSARSREATLEGMGPIRPTLLESGRETPSPSPAGR